MAVEANPALLEKVSDNEEENIMLAVLKEDYKKDPKFWTRLSKQIKGVSEETTTGVHRLYQIHKR